MHAPSGIFHPLRDRDPVQAGGYRLRARLGSGGMGEVFLSFDASGQPVAVKVLRGEFADDRRFRSRFAQEVRSARRVRGPGIAPLVDADPEAEAPWLATAYVAGPTLAEAVELYGKLPVASVIVLMSGIAGSLRAIHDSGIVHRDLKPANVVLGPDGLRVIDFGIARAADATPLTLTGMMVGSPQYVAPEQVIGEPPTPAGDVFSLGALAHYAATGRPAFGDGPRIAVLYRIVNELPDLAGCPRQIRSLIESCLAKDPADRPTTAELLETCTPDEPPRTAADWLPEPVLHAIGAYQAALAELEVTPHPEADAEADAGAGAGAAVGAESSADDGPAAETKASRDRAPRDRTPKGGARESKRRRPAGMRTVVATGAGVPSRDTDADTDTVRTETLVRPGSVRGPDSWLRRNVISLATASAVIAAAVAIALGISSIGSSPGSPAADGGGPTQDAASQSVASQSGGGGQNGAGGAFDAGGPPSIPGLGRPLGPPGGGRQGGGPPPAGPGGDAAPAPTVLWWSGTVRLTSDGLWMDGRPPISGQGHGDLREIAPAPTALVSGAGPDVPNIARWAAGGTPSAVQCRDYALSHGMWQVHVAVGDFLCVLTAYRQVAVLHIEAVPADDSGMTAAATVWGDTPSASSASSASGTPSASSAPEPSTSSR